MNLITGEKIQTLCDYYIGTNDDFNFNPVIRNQSPKHINIDNYTHIILMGGIAYNINIPKDLYYLKLDTDDIDLKVYTTQLNYLNIDNPQNINNVKRVMSTIKFTLNIICLFLIMIHQRI